MTCPRCSGSHYICYENDGLKCEFQSVDGECDLHGRKQADAYDDGVPIHDVNPARYYVDWVHKKERKDEKDEWDHSGYLIKEETQEAWVKWVARQRPELLITLTFENTKNTLPGETSVPGVQRARGALRRWKKMAQWICPWGIVVAEYGKANMRLHLHALVRVTEGIEVPTAKKMLDAAWGQGFTDIVVVEHPDEAARYVAKYVMKQDGPSSPPIFEAW